MALIKCKGCGHMVSDRAEKCPKCGYSVRLSVKQGQEETKQSLEFKLTTETEKKEEANIKFQPQPQQRSSKKGVIIAVVVVISIIIGCGALFVVLNGNDNNDSNDQHQEFTTIDDTEAIKQDEWFTDTEEIRQDELPSDSMNVAKESDDFIVYDSCATEAWEYITLRGTMTDMNGTYPIELSFEKDGDVLMNCIYTNVDLGGKIRMEGEVVGSDYIFTGKDGRYKFQIQIDRYTFDGIATDGPKELIVSLENKY